MRDAVVGAIGAVLIGACVAGTPELTFASRGGTEAPARACPADPGTLPVQPGRSVRCARADGGSVRVYRPAGAAADYRVLRIHDRSPLALGAEERISYALRTPDGRTTPGRDLTDELRAGTLSAATPEQAAELLAGALHAAFDAVHGPLPSADPQDTSLRDRVRHLPPPRVERVGDGLELFAYGLTQAAGPGAADLRTTVDQVHVRLAPDGARTAVQLELGRLFDEGRQAGRSWAGWRPDAAPEAPPAGTAPR